MAHLVSCDFGGEEADVVHIAVVLGIVHAVANDELVGDAEGDIVGLDGDKAACGFVEAGGDLERGWLVLEHEAAQIAEGQAGVEDVLDDDDVLAFDGVIDVLDELDGSRGDAGAAIAGDGDEVEGGVDRDGTREVGEEDRRALEDTDQDNGLAFVISGDLLADGGDSLGDLRAAVEDVHGAGGGKDGRTDRHKG